MHQQGRLNLNPPYQRNNIWTEKAQKALIYSIKSGMPIPTFFLHERNNGDFDVADGQQRSRAIFKFIKSQISGLVFTESNEQNFLFYELPTVIIDKSVTQEEIREFYVMVNNTGVKLNRPELTKAAHFDSPILNLVEELTDSLDFKTLKLFQEKQSDRMIDREFVEELVALLYYGIGDKKNDVKKIYEASLSQKDISDVQDKFNEILRVLVKYNIDNANQFSNSRYVQRNDFYTLFKFIGDNISLNLNVFLDILIKIQYDISPSNYSSQELQFYAYNCVSQSNSKQAREARFNFLGELLLNTSSKPNKVQKNILKYYKLQDSDMLQEGEFLVLNPKYIQTQFNK